MKASTENLIARLLLPRYSERLNRANLYAFVRSWCRVNAGMRTFLTREDLWRYAAQQEVPEGPIDYLEFGVLAGDSIGFWANMNSDPGSRFFGFDSFLGLPEDWGTDFPAGAFSTGGRIPQVGDSRVRFVKGWFQDTLPTFFGTFAPRHPIVVHLDADVYTSTLFCLAQLDFLLNGERGVLLFDEFGGTPEFSAFRDYSRSFRRNFQVLGGVRWTDRTVFGQVAFRLPASATGDSFQ